ncbi:MAG: carbon-nitrogen family hydrolase [Thermodesulfobacteriota bacterium]|nr:carbon-nitrogen family hydrolase [Thermodesulfobacteriota bacterium]
MKVASIQMNIGDEGKSDRIMRAEKLLDQAKGADLVILPEIWNIGYFSFDLYEKESEPLEGETARRMSAKAREHGFYLHAGSFVEKNNDKLYNTSLFIDPDGKRMAVYRKIHLFGYGSNESQILSGGHEIVVVETPLGKMGMSTCYDLRFPELFRAMLKKGAELFLVTSGWPYPRLEHWLMFNRIRAIENTAFLVSSNCVGIHRGVQFCGHSMMVDPWGVILASGGDEECILRSDIEIERVSSVRKIFPAVSDRVL